jgi:hypothetical protein
MNKQGAHFAGYCGHLVDLWRLLTFQHYNPHSYSKFRNLKSVAVRTNATQLIETGTYVGNTAMRCSRHFEKIYTIELDEKLAAKAAAYLRRRPNVEVIQGDALAELPKILARPTVENVLVFLDGHFSGGDTALGDQPEPACDAITVLAQFKDKIRGIVVDDFRCFGRDKGWPTKSDLLHAIESYFNDQFDITIHLDQVLVFRRQEAPVSTAPGAARPRDRDTRKQVG